MQCQTLNLKLECTQSLLAILCWKLIAGEKTPENDCNPHFRIDGGLSCVRLTLPEYSSQVSVRHLRSAPSSSTTKSWIWTVLFLTGLELQSIKFKGRVGKKTCPEDGMEARRSKNINRTPSTRYAQHHSEENHPHCPITIS